MSQRIDNGHLHQGRFGLSLLNSMIGEYLEKENNPLAVQMGFYHESKKISFDSSLDSQFNFELSNKVVIFVHGLTNLENVWDYPPDEGTTASILGHYIDVYLDEASVSEQQTYGSKLHNEFGFTPLFLRYNTGLSIEKNGRYLNKLLEQLCEQYPIAIEELVLVGYGIGGKLISHTQYAATKSKASWLEHLTRCLYLGNLNEASFLTLLLHLSSNFIRQMPMKYSESLADLLDKRGRQLHEQNHVALRTQSRKAKSEQNWSFLEDKQHFFIGGSLKPSYMDTVSRQSFVIPPSAPVNSQNAFIEGISPIRLTHSDRVYDIIAKWLHSGSAPKVELKTYTPQNAFPIQQLMFKGMASNDVDANKVFIAGTVDLLASAYDKTVETLETMHYSMAEEPFYAMDKVPVVSQIAKPVEAAQREVLDSIYKGLRDKGKKMHKYASDMV